MTPLQLMLDAPVTWADLGRLIHRAACRWDEWQPDYAMRGADVAAELLAVLKQHIHGHSAPVPD